MKKLLIIVVVLVCLVGLVLGYALINANSLVQQFKPDMEKMASSALGSTVTLGNLSVSVFPETKILVDEFKVSDGKEHTSLKNLTLKVNLMALLSGALTISELGFSKPEITLIKDANGTYLAGLPKPAAVKDAPPVTPTTPTTPAGAPPAPPKALNINLDRFFIHDASVAVKEMNGTINKLVQGFNVDAGLNIANGVVNVPSVNVNGKVLNGVPFALKAAASVADGKATVSTAALTIIESIINAAGSFNIAQGTGNFVATSDSLDIGSLMGKVVGGVDGIKSSPAKFKADLAKTTDGVAVPKFHVDAFGGTIDGDVTLKGSDFANKTTISNLNIKDALFALNPTGVQLLTGTLESLNLTIGGALGATLMQSLKGNVTVGVKDGALVGMNIAGSVLKAVNSLPFLSGSLYGQLGESEKSAVDGEDTAIKTLSADIGIADAGLNVKSLSLDGGVFALEADGRIQFDTEIRLNGTIYFSPAFSAALVTRTDKLKALLDPKGRLTIPLQLTGKPPKILILPNVEKLLELGAKQALKEGLQKGAEKLLGGGGKGKGLGGMFGF